MTKTTDLPTYGMSRILSLAWPERKMIGSGLFFLVISSAMLLSYPQAVRLIIDEALGSGNTAAIDRTSLIILAVFIAQGFAAAFRYYFFTLAGERIVARLRGDVYQSIVEQDIAFFDSRRTGELMSRLSSDSTILQNAVSINISITMRNFGSAIGGLVLLVYTSPTLTGGLLLCVPLIALGTVILGKRLKTISRDVQDAVAETGVVAEETISGIRTVRSFAKESFEVSRYKSVVQESYKLARLRIKTIATITAIGSCLGFSAIVAVLWYGGRLVVAGHMTVGDLTSFILYAMTVAISFGALGSQWTELMAATGAARRIFEILDRKPLIVLNGGQKPEQMKGRIDFKAVSFSYPSRPDYQVLKALDLAIEAGEVVALVGPSGSGKSTIAALLSRFYDPASGSVLIDSLDLRGLDGNWLHQHIGVVSQDPVLLSGTIAANIRYGKADASDEAVRDAARAANAAGFVENFPDAYETIVGERGVQLSGGQRQRVAIARAMLKDPRILILDEATSALDAESEHLVQEALDRLMKGRTTLVIAHRLSTVRNADRVLVIQAGEVVESGIHETLMKNTDGVYHRLVNRQYVEILE
ncbi:MAG: ATP-binding cassette domain-containing protein [Chitinophagaceae bacterium]|nr:ATP-binding cassette domain-containing protein [Oligoflexus sp.]